MSIAVKQVMPDHVVVRTPIGKITNRNIPLSVFGLTFIMWAIGKGNIDLLKTRPTTDRLSYGSHSFVLGMVEGSYCTMFGIGLVIAWIYLRFYQV